MFIAVLFIAIGLAILLNTFGILNGTVWGVFWALFFLAVGIKMIVKRNKCPMCGWGVWKGGMHERMHEKMEGHCCDNDHEDMKK